VFFFFSFDHEDERGKFNSLLLLSPLFPPFDLIQGNGAEKQWQPCVRRKQGFHKKIGPRLCFSFAFTRTAPVCTFSCRQVNVFVAVCFSSSCSTL
jgi:hypothetical protein